VVVIRKKLSNKTFSPGAQWSSGVLGVRLVYCIINATSAPLLSDGLWSVSNSIRIAFSTLARDLQAKAAAGEWQARQTTTQQQLTAQTGIMTAQEVQIKVQHHHCILSADHGPHTELFTIKSFQERSFVTG